MFIFVGICWYMLLFVDISCYCFIHVFLYVCWYWVRLFTIACYCGCKSPKSIPRSIPKVYPEVYQKCCWSAHYALFVISCSYFLLFVCSCNLLLLLGSVILVWCLLLLVGIRKYSKTFVHYLLLFVGICWYLGIFVDICCYSLLFCFNLYSLIFVRICWYV